jgi:sugar-specific transcriptional regulator TrmB
MIETHNGHKVISLDTVYNKIKHELQNEKREIEEILLPKYKELLAKENATEANISKRTGEVQLQIEEHTEKLIDRFISKVAVVRDKRIQDLQRKGTEALHSVGKSKTEIERRIKTLNETKTQISNNLGAMPGITFFKATNGNILREMGQFPKSFEYKLSSFFPSDIERMTMDINIGNVPEFSKVDSSEGEHFLMSEQKHPRKEKSSYELLKGLTGLHLYDPFSHRERSPSPPPFQGRIQRGGPGGPEPPFFGGPKIYF